MHPYLVRIGWLSISSYGVALAAAFLLVIALTRRATERSLRGLVPLASDAVVDWAVWALLGGLVGGRIFYIGLSWDSYAFQPWEIIAIWHGGLVWYGGLLGGLAASILYFRVHRSPILSSLDHVIPFVAFGHAIGRIGCFLNGCCYGKPTAAWYGVQFPNLPSPVIPTQLIESASLIVLFLVLRRLQRPAVLRRPGMVFGAYLVGYAVIRWTVEWWRVNPVVWAGWTLYQLISIGVFVTGIGVILSRLGLPTGAATRTSAGR